MADHPRTLQRPIRESSSRIGLRLSGLDALLQFLGGTEGDLFARLDFDGLSGRRVPSHACCPFLNLQDTETSQPDLIALLQMPGCNRHPKPPKKHPPPLPSFFFFSSPP